MADYFGLLHDAPTPALMLPLFVTDAEQMILMEHVNRAAHPERVGLKKSFESFCREHGLRTVGILASCAGGASPVQWLEKVPRDDLFLKPAALWGGMGAGILTYEGEDAMGTPTWRFSDGVLVTQDTLASHAPNQVGDAAWILQPRLRNGPVWRDFSPGALCTVRVVTGRHYQDGPVEVIGGFMRFPRAGASVDNLSSGGLGTDYDPRTGRLGLIRDMDGRAPRTVEHPDTGAKIGGELIPGWDKIAALACKAHSSVSDIAMIGWDIALPDEDPLLIEANPNWGIFLDTPLGATAYVEILTAPEMHHRVFGSA